MLSTCSRLYLSEPLNLGSEPLNLGGKFVIGTLALDAQIAAEVVTSAVADRLALDIVARDVADAHGRTGVQSRPCIRPRLDRPMGAMTMRQRLRHLRHVRSTTTVAASMSGAVPHRRPHGHVRASELLSISLQCGFSVHVATKIDTLLISPTFHRVIGILALQNFDVRQLVHEVPPRVKPLHGIREHVAAVRILARAIRLAVLSRPIADRLV